jgi:hypothetical protein
MRWQRYYRLKIFAIFMAVARWEVHRCRHHVSRHPEIKEKYLVA